MYSHSLTAAMKLHAGSQAAYFGGVLSPADGKLPFQFNEHKDHTDNKTTILLGRIYLIPYGQHAEPVWHTLEGYPGAQIPRGATLNL